jgi:hypothetical protein
MEIVAIEGNAFEQMMQRFADFAKQVIESPLWGRQEQ